MIRPSLFACGLCMCLALPVAGCENGSAESTPPASPTLTQPRWQLEFVLSGGIVGSQRMIELSSAGTLIITDKKNDTPVTLQVPNDELTRVFALVVEATRLQPTGKPPMCRDCFQYDLTVQMAGQRFSYQVNDLNISAAGLAPLVKALNELQERVTAGQL
jgi:hypothetical protein